MLKTIINSIIDELEAADVENVYSAFDAYTIENKGDIFTIIGIGAFETSPPIYTMAYAYVPFRAEVDISITATKSMTMEELYDYYTDNIEAALLQMTDMRYTLKKLSLKFDSNIQRLVLNVKLETGGITKLERNL